MRFVAFIASVLLLAGCATHLSRVRSYEYYLAAAQKEVEGIPMFTQSGKYWDFFRRCDKGRKQSKREKCIVSFLESTTATINLTYPAIDRENVREVYAATKTDVIAEGLKRARDEKWDVDSDVLEASIGLQLYELIARQSHIRNLAANRREDAMGRAVARDVANTAALSSLTQTLNYSVQQMQLQQISEKQDRILWQQKNEQYKRTGGAMPTQ